MFIKLLAMDYNFLNEFLSKKHLHKKKKMHFQYQTGSMLELGSFFLSHFKYQSYRSTHKKKT